MIHYVGDDVDLAAVVTGAADTVMLRAGATFSAAAVPAGMLSPSGITVGMWGSGSKPIITGGVTRADWSYDAGNDVYSRSAVAANTLGNVTEDGVPMKFVAWDTDIATTAAAMTDGQDLPYWSGSMTFDPVARIVYIRPSSGAASAHAYVVSESSFGLMNSASSTGLVIEDIGLRSISRHAILLQQKRGAVLRRIDARVIGGAIPVLLYMGNGIELSIGCDGSTAEDCYFADIFDTAVTAQLYETAPARLGGIEFSGITADRCGMHGVEISAQTANQFLHDVETSNVRATDGGLGWSRDRNGAAVTVLSNSSSSRLTRCFARDVAAVSCKRLYLGYAHGGVCGIEDSAGTDTWGQAPRSDANGVSGQRDLWRGVTDNLGAPSGGAWAQVSARLADTYKPIIL